MKCVRVAAQIGKGDALACLRTIADAGSQIQSVGASCKGVLVRDERNHVFVRAHHGIGQIIFIGDAGGIFFGFVHIGHIFRKSIHLRPDILVDPVGGIVVSLDGNGGIRPFADVVKRAVVEGHLLRLCLHRDGDGRLLRGDGHAALCRLRLTAGRCIRVIRCIPGIVARRLCIVRFGVVLSVFRLRRASAGCQ